MMQKDNNNAISEKLSQSAAEQAPEPTVKASLIAKRGEE